MKIRYLFVVVFTLSIVQLQAQLDDQFPRLKRNNQTTSCKCYCSYKCGPRNADQPDDKPFISKKYYSPYTERGICFCQQRDEDKYEEHQCQITAEEEEQITCCPQYNY